MYIHTCIITQGCVLRYIKHSLLLMLYLSVDTSIHAILSIQTCISALANICSAFVLCVYVCVCVFIDARYMHTNQSFVLQQ